MDELHNAGGGTAGYGFPKGDAVEQNGRLFQEFEGGSISMCGGADRNKQQLCVDNVQPKFEAGQKPVIHIVYGNATKVSIEVSTSPSPNHANHFEYKILDYWPTAGDSGETYYQIQDTLLWSNSRDGQVQKIYYKVTTKRGDDRPIDSFPSNNAFGEEATFEKVIKTPEYINPLENDPYYSEPTTYVGHGLAWDVAAAEGSNVKTARAGTVVEASLWTYNGCWQVPGRNGTTNSVLSIRDSDGRTTKYRHMSVVSMNRIINGDPATGVAPYKPGTVLGQNKDAGDVDDLGCSTPGFDHLHIEMFDNTSGEVDPKTYILF